MTSIQTLSHAPRFAVADLDARFYCPITCELMQDPVAIEGDSTGQAYERAAIEEWFRCCVGPKRAPTSNVEFTRPVLVALCELRQQIQDRTGTPAPSAPPVEMLFAPPTANDFYDAPLKPAAQPACAPLQAFAPQQAPSAPPYPSSFDAPSRRSVPAAHASHHETAPSPARRALPTEIGASASDFKKVVSLGRGHITAAVRPAQTLAATVSGAVGAVGGLGGAMGVTAGLLGALGSVVLTPCLAVAAGLGVVGAGVGAGAWIRRDRARLAKAQPEIARKLAALHEMRKAFATLYRPTAAEKSVLKDVDATIDLIDSPRADWLRSLKWAAGAALIAIPIGLLAGLAVAKHVNDANRTDADKEDDSAKTQATGEAPRRSERFDERRGFTANDARRSASGNTFNIHVGPRYESPNPFAHIISEMLLHHQFGRTQVEPFAHKTSVADDATVRVPMKARWLEALDSYSHSRFVEHAAA